MRHSDFYTTLEQRILHKREIRKWSIQSKVIEIYQQTTANLDIDGASLLFRRLITGFLQIIILVLIAVVKMVEENDSASAAATLPLHSRTNGKYHQLNEEAHPAGASNQQVAAIFYLACISYFINM